MAKLVSKTYGDALFASAKEQNRIDEFFEGAKDLLNVFETNQELGKLLSHPKIAKEDKIKIIEETFRDCIAKEMMGLITLLIAKGHAKDITSVFTYFIDQVKEEKKIGIAYVTTAVPISGEHKESILERLLATTHYETFEMHYQVDESLIGGLLIRIGDRVVDSTIKTKLYELSRDLRKIQIQ